FRSSGAAEAPQGATSQDVADARPAEQAVPFVEHGALPRVDTVTGFAQGDTHARAVLTVAFEQRRNRRRAVAELHKACAWSVQFPLRTETVETVREKGAAVQIVLAAEVDVACGRIDLADEQGFAGRDAETFALAHGVERHAPVGSEVAAIRPDEAPLGDVDALGFGAGRHHLAVVSPGHETDVLALTLGGRAQARLMRQRAHFRLGQPG